MNPISDFEYGSSFGSLPPLETKNELLKAEVDRLQGELEESEVARRILQEDKDGLAKETWTLLATNGVLKAENINLEQKVWQTNAAFRSRAVEIDDRDAQITKYEGAVAVLFDRLQELTIQMWRAEADDDNDIL